MMLSHAEEGGAGGERAETRSAALFAESSKVLPPPPVAIAVTEAAASAKGREERTVLLAGFDAFEAGQQGTDATDGSSGSGCKRCCASRRPPAGWRIALGAAAVWALVMLAGWTAVVMAQRSRAAAPLAMQSSTMSLAARSTALADICDPLELEACAGSQPWWNGGIVYQVYPRSFQDSDGDGVGDLKGALQRIDYIASLNVSAIWLSPVFPSPMHDFGYDVSDYKNIHPMFGSLADLDALVAAAHQRGLRVLLDLVPNHTSDAHPWFSAAASSRTSPKRDYYVWVEPPSNATASGGAGPPGPPPNNWRSFFGGSAWSWEPNTRSFYLHQYLPSQPDLNWRSPDVQAEFADIMQFWQHRGIDGFRIDSLPTLLEDAQLHDEPPNLDWHEGMDPHDALLHINHTQDVFPIHKVVKHIRSTADTGNSVLVCETRVGLHELAKFYGPHLHECQLPFNFDLVDWTAAWSGKQLKDAITSYLAGLPRGAVPTWVLGNHDNPRVATRLGGERQARAALLLLLSLPGTPTVYNGEELGMHNVALRDDQVRDPAALRQPRELWPVVGRDPERTPMQWDATRAAGFLPASAPAAATPWLPVSPDYTTVNAAAQSGNATSTLSLFRLAAALRRAEPTLRGAPLIPLDWAGSDAVPAGVVAFARPLRCACGNVTRRTARASDDDQPEASGDDYDGGDSDLPGQPPSAAPAPAPAPAPVPRFNATSFVFALNMGPAPVILDLRAAMARASLGADGWESAMVLSLDSDDVATRAGLPIDAAALSLQSWQAVLLSVRLDAHGAAT